MAAREEDDSDVPEEFTSQKVFYLPSLKLKNHFADLL